MNLCMECSCEWEEEKPLFCPKCGCGDFHSEESEEDEIVKREFNYENISIKDIENNSHLIFICDADNKKVEIEREKE